MTENTNTMYYHLVEEYLKNCGASKEDLIPADVLRFDITDNQVIWNIFEETCSLRFALNDPYSRANKALITLFPYIVSYFKTLDEEEAVRIYNKHCRYFSADGQVQGY